MRFSPYLLFGAQVAALTTPSTDPGLKIRADPLKPPVDDSFYDVVWGGKHHSPSLRGDVITYRSVDLPNYKNVRAAYQVAYRTSNGRGMPIAAITTVIVPLNSDKKHVVSYQLSTNAAWINCAPSWKLVQGEDEPDIQSLLDRGWVVNTPDHEGTQADFGVGNGGGKRTLDSLRALQNLPNITGILDPKFALWGYSGGSIATGWTAELKQEYADELDISGAAVGGYIVDLKATALHVNKGPLVGLVPPALIGLSDEFSIMEIGLRTELKEDKVAELDKARSQCSAANFAQFAGQDIFDYFKSGDDAFKNRDIADTFTSSKAGQHAPQIPLLVYQGLKDEIAPYEEVDNIVENYCSKGTSVRYIRGGNYTHLQMAFDFSATAIEWIADVFAGKANSTCTYVNATQNVTPDPLRTDPDPPDTDPKSPGSDPSVVEPQPPKTDLQSNGLQMCLRAKPTLRAPT